MKKYTKILALTIVILFLISSPIGVFSKSSNSGEGGIIGFIFPPFPMISPINCNLGNLEKGISIKTSFDVWNGEIDYPLDNITIDDLEWFIIIPDFFSSFITVSPMSGVSKATYPTNMSGKGEYSDFVSDITTVIVDLNTTGMINGIYKCEIEIYCYRPGGLLESIKYFTLKFCIGPQIAHSDDFKVEGENDGARYYLDFEIMGENQVKSKTFKLWNKGYDILNFEINKEECYKVYTQNYQSWGALTNCVDVPCNWFTINPLSGSSESKLDKKSINVTVDTSALEYDLSYDDNVRYESKINVVSNSEEVFTFYIRVRVGPKLMYGIDGDTSKKVFDFGDLFRGDVNSTTFQVWNGVPGLLTVNLSVPYWLANHLTITPTDAVSMGPDDPINVTVSVDTTAKFTDLHSEGPGSIGLVVKVRSDLGWSTYNLYSARPGYHEDNIQIYSNDPIVNNDAPGETGGKPPTRERYPKFIVNYYMGECRPDEHYDMLIITTEALKDTTPIYPRDLTYLEMLKKAHEEKDNITSKIVTMEEIYEKYCYPNLGFYTASSNHPVNLPFQASQAVQNALSLREFLRDAKFHWDISYVLLVGSDKWEMEQDEKDSTKWKKVGNYEDYASCILAGNKRYGVDSTEVPTFQISVDGNPASDRPYSCLGTKKDDRLSFDYYKVSLQDREPVVYVGRVPAEKPGDVVHFVEKTIKYMESSDSDYLTATVASHYLGFTYNHIDGYCIDRNLTPCDCEDYGWDSDDLNWGRSGGYCVDINGTQIPCPDGYGWVNDGDDDTGGSNNDGYAGWNRFFVPYTGMSEEFVVNINTLFPYKYIVKVWNETTEKYDEIEKLRNLYINEITLLAEEYREEREGRDENGTLFGYSLLDRTVDHVSLGIEEIVCSTDTDECGSPHDLQGWSDTTNYAGIQCRSINYKDNPFGGSVTLHYTETNDPLVLESEMKGFTIQFYDHSNENYDTFIVRVNGEIVASFSDLPQEIDDNGDSGGGCNSGYDSGSHQPVYGSLFKEKTIDYCNKNGFETFGIPSQVFDITQLHDEPGGWPAGHPSYRWSGDLFTYKTGLINYLVGESAPTFLNVLFYPKHLGYYVEAPVYGLSQRVWHEPFDNPDGPYPIMFDLKGFSGWFDSIGGSACEALVCEEGGVVAGVFKSTSLNPLTQLSDLTKCDREFYDALFGERIPTLGAAFYDALVDASVNLYDLNLFGDPALKVKGTNNHRPNAVINCSTGKNGSGQIIQPYDTVLPGSSLIFDASGSYDVDGRVESYSWDFSDGFVSSNVSLKYAFNRAGVYVFRLNVTDNNGGIGGDKFVINVVDPSNNQSVISLESPVDGTADVPVDIGMVSVKIVDPDDDCFDWSISFSPDVGFNSGVESSSGFKTCTLSNPLEYNTTYTWTVSAMDYGSGITTESVFSFTTLVDSNGDDGDGGDEPDPLFNLPPEISLICPSDGSEDVSVNLSSLEASIFDPEGDCFDWSIQTNPDIGSANVDGDSNGTKTCSISDLQFNTTYSWTVIATDSGSEITVEETFVFATEVNNTNDKENNEDEDEPVDESDDNISVELIKPIDGGLYVFNELKRESFSTIIIGDIDIIASVIGENTTRISSVNFYIDNQLLDSIDFNSSISEYKYVLDGKYIGMFTLKVEAVNSEEIILASDSVDCFIFNFGLI